MAVQPLNWYKMYKVYKEEIVTENTRKSEINKCI